MPETKITIYRLIPSGNKQTFGHWRDYQKERNVWYNLLRIRLQPQEPPTVKVFAEIISYRQRLLDYGNLVAGSKAIPDGLKKLGIIRDDSPTWFECAYSQIKVCKKDERTEIMVKGCV